SAEAFVPRLNKGLTVRLDKMDFVTRIRTSRSQDKAGLEPEEESNGGLCKVSNLVRIESAQTEVRDFVQQASVFRSHAEFVRHVEIDATAVHECRFRLTVRSTHDDLIRRVKYQRARAGQSIRADLCDFGRNVSDKRSRQLVKVGLKRGLAERPRVVICVSCI